jgi:hypothetical protein
LACHAFGRNDAARAPVIAQQIFETQLSLILSALLALREIARKCLQQADDCARFA